MQLYFPKEVLKTPTHLLGSASDVSLYFNDVLTPRSGKTSSTRP